MQLRSGIILTRNEKGFYGKLLKSTCTKVVLENRIHQDLGPRLNENNVIHYNEMLARNHELYISRQLSGLAETDNLFIPIGLKLLKIAKYNTVWKQELASIYNGDDSINTDITDIRLLTILRLRVIIYKQLPTQKCAVKIIIFLIAIIVDIHVMLDKLSLQEFQQPQEPQEPQERWK